VYGVHKGEVIAWSTFETISLTATINPSLTGGETVTIQPYLFFDGRCDEAIEFYKRVLGAEVTMLMQFKDSPDPTMIRPGTENKVMHSSFRIGDSTILASDGMCSGQPANFQGFSLSVTVKDEAEAEKKFNALADGGQVRMPLSKTFFAKSFGMLADRFGVGWMVIAPAEMHG
jgi:PhnB protein